MPIFNNFLTRNKHTIFWIFFLFLYAASVAYAVPPTTYYSQGETLDPNCAPGDTKCSVLIIPDQTGNNGKYLTTDGTQTSWGSTASSQWTTTGPNIYYNTGNVGIGTSTPGQKLDVAGNVNISSGSAYMYNGVNVIRAQTALNNYFFGNSGNLTMTGTNNTASGSSSLFSNTTGAVNTATGYLSLRSNTTGSNNTATGAYSLFSNTTGVYNTANGYESLYSNTTGTVNTAAGLDSLYSNTTGSENTANGYRALMLNTSGSGNTATGSQSLFTNTTGANNTATGSYSLVSSTTGIANLANGYQSLYSNTTGSYSAANGANSLYFNTTGSSNTANGYQSLYSLTTGSFNTAIGYNSGLSLTTGSNNTIIGANVTVGDSNLSNNIIIADGAGNQRINVNSTGALNFSSYGVGTNSGTAAYALQVDASGNVIEGAVGGSALLGSTSTLGTETWLGGATLGTASTTDTVFVGINAGLNATNASYSSFIGWGAGNAATNADHSIFIGSQAGDSATGAQYSNFLGDNAGGNASLAFQSNFFGPYAGNGATNAGNSNFFGANAGYQAINAANSIFIGLHAGDSDIVDNTSNNLSSILIGQYTNTGGYSNSILLGSGTFGSPISNTKVNQFMLADSITNVRLGGVEYTLPSSQAAGAGDLLANNGSGTLSWATAPVSFYSTDGTLSSNRTVELNSNSLTINQSGSAVSQLIINPSTYETFLASRMTPAGAGTFLDLQSTSDVSIVQFTLLSQTAFNVNQVRLYGNSIDQTLTIDAGNGTNFNGGATTFNGDITVNGTGATTFNGDITVSGSGTTCTIGNGVGATLCSSDQRLKKNITPLSDSLDSIMALRPVTFNWIDSHKPQGTNIGFIAQEVQRIFPQFVGVIDSKTGMLGLDYAALITPTIKAVQELKLKLDDIQNLLPGADGNISFADKLVVWLANATNHITRIFTGEICLTDPDGTSECLNKTQLSQLKNLLQANVVTPTPPTPDPTPVPPTPDPVPPTLDPVPLTPDTVNPPTPDPVI